MRSSNSTAARKKIGAAAMMGKVTAEVKCSV